MDERCGLSSSTCSAKGQLAQFVVDERQQLVRSGGVALLDLRQDSRDVAHENQDTATAGAIPSGMCWLLRVTLGRCSSVLGR